MPIKRSKYSVPTDQLRRFIEPVSAEQTEQTDLSLGQDDALSSMDIGLHMADDEYAQRHYNIVVVGSPKTGRTKQTLKHLERWAAQQPYRPPDAVAVHDFDSPRRFIVAHVANGAGHELADMMLDFGKKAITELPQVAQDFQQDNDTSRKLEEAREHIFIEASKAIHHLSCAIQHDDETGQIRITPVSLQDPTQPITKEELESLSEDVRQEVDQRWDKAMAIAKEFINAGMRKLEETFGNPMEDVFRMSIDHARETCDQWLEPIRELAAGNAEFERYLRGLTKHVSALAAQPQEQEGPFSDGSNQMLAAVRHWCEIRVLVDNGGCETKPVIFEDKPSYTSLFGCPHAEQVSANATRMDHTMVEGGSFLAAHGGCLVLDCRNLLRLGRDPAFVKLLEVMRTGKLTIETMPAFLDLETIVDYRSSEIPVDVRVVLICNPRLEMLLRSYEPDFDNLFRVVSEFETELPLERAKPIYSRFVEICQRTDDLPNFSPKAIAKLMEYGARRAGDQNKASIELGFLKDAIRQSAYWARRSNAKWVSPKHVRQAFQAQYESRSRYIRRYQDYVDSGQMLLSLDGGRAGQINGLVVMQLPGDVMFGMPKRITANVYAGQGGVVLVQRQTKQSGPLSNTAIEEIIGYFYATYGRDKAIALTARLSFEQTYGGVDGDSATVAEYVAMISALTGLPVDQRGVVTGSMNQLGDVQPIGGVNEKVEGHYHLLKRKGLLSSEHFAVVPKLNVHQFMLDEQLVSDHRRGRYHIYGIDHVDQALEIFLKTPMKKINELVFARLEEMREKDSDKNKSAKK